MKRIIKIVLSLIGKLITRLLNFYILYRIYNCIYNRIPHWLADICVKFIGLPDNDLTWDIRLLNKKNVKTRIIRGNIKTAEFALAYRWHSSSLNFTEYLLNSYYGKEVAWIDVGSNLGLRSLLALSENKRVCFIEPNRELNRLNEERCAQNGFTGYAFYEVGASDRQGEADFLIDKTSYNSSLEFDLEKKEDTDRVERIKIDTLDNLFRFQDSDFKKACIKIDVEGHELQVLRGSEHLINSVSPAMIIEVNEKGEHFAQFLKLMNKLEYEVFEIGSFKHKKYFRRVGPSCSFSKNRLTFNDFLTIKDKLLVSFVEKYTISS